MFGEGQNHFFAALGRNASLPCALAQSPPILVGMMKDVFFAPCLAGYNLLVKIRKQNLEDPG